MQGARRKAMKSFPVLLIAILFANCLRAESGRIYTKPDPNSLGGIRGRIGVELNRAIAVDHQRIAVYLGDLSDGGKAFQFAHLPTGKYDLVLLAKDGTLYEGLALGGPPDAIPPASLKNLDTRIAVADSFFNRYTIHRIGIDGEHVLAFVERIRDKLTLKQSGEKLDSNLRRLEVIELDQAADDWQMATTRHLYREDEPVTENPPFLKHVWFSGLGNIRVVDSVKDMGLLVPPKN
jgi:hypothetical protein